MAAMTNVLSSKYNIHDEQFKEECKHTLYQDGMLILPDFITSVALQKIKEEGEAKQNLAYHTNSNHNIYISPSDAQYGDEHIRNRQVISSKGCITDDQIDSDSPLRTLYDDSNFRDFLSFVLCEQGMYNYADRLSSINIHYASDGKELGWHYDNSSFAITLLIQKPQAGAEFEYVRDVRNADEGDMAFEKSQHIVDGITKPETVNVEEGTLVLFRGRNSIHRVRPTKGEITRMMVVLAYNSQPNVSLSESARMTFYGRLD